jgi:hypothetical protein
MSPSIHPLAQSYAIGCKASDAALVDRRHHIFPISVHYN